MTQAMADLTAWQRLSPLLTEYLPFSTGALRPTGLAALLDEILLDDRTVLLECGAGASSVVIARMLARRGFGRLLSLGHSERSVAFVTSQLRRERLVDVAKVVHAPLTPHPDAVDGLSWYHPETVYRQVVAYIDRHGLADLLFVDGPPASRPGRALARYPALPVLRGALAPGAAVLLDDIDRPDESALLTRWSDEFGLRFRTDPLTQLARAVLPTS